jgi:ACS family allantoate permease-like MFS transporter
MLSSIPNGGLSNFSSILLTTFGYTSQQALILNAPSGAIGLITVLGVGWLSDRWRDRSSVMLICVIPTILAAGLMIGLDPNGVPKNKPGLLAASFLAGTFGAAFMLLLAWNASYVTPPSYFLHSEGKAKLKNCRNIGGHTKKVTVNAMTLVSFALGNIMGAESFQNDQAPGYISGKISIAATLGALCLVVLVLRWYNDMLNKKKDKVLAEMSEEERVELGKTMLFADETDRRNPFFRYTH